MFRKRIWIVAALLICVMGMTACKKNVGSPEDNAVQEESETEEKEEVKETFLVGFTAIDMENPYFITLENAVREVVEEEGWTRWITKDPKTDAKLQKTDPGDDLTKVWMR